MTQQEELEYRLAQESLASRFGVGQIVIYLEGDKFKTIASGMTMSALAPMMLPLLQNWLSRKL